MRIAVPQETKNREYRVALTEDGVLDLVNAGHEVFVQSGAGEGSSITDAMYREAGATLVDTAEETWASGELVLKVKEPIDSEYGYLREDMVLFTYLHLAADRPLTERLIEAGTTAIAYETVRREDGQLPLLYPMSEVAGSLAPIVGAHTLMKDQGGRGVLLGDISGVPKPKVAIIGGGVAGQSAAKAALGLCAEVTVLDNNLDKLRDIATRFGDQVHGVMSNAQTIEKAVVGADLVIGTVLIPGEKAPKLVTDAMVSQMRKGAVLVDVAIDQGGCFEHSRPTTHDDPTFTVHDTVYYCVANMPGAVPATSTQGLTYATLPYVHAIASHGWRQALSADPALALGLNVEGGRIRIEGVHAAFEDLPYEEWTPTPQ